MRLLVTFRLSFLQCSCLSFLSLLKSFVNIVIAFLFFLRSLSNAAESNIIS